MKSFVKICGNASLEDALAVADLRPDALGFILWPGSKRYVAPERLAEWIPQVPGEMLTVGVFVDAAPSEVDRVMKLTGLKVAQLHGHEDAAAYAMPDRVLWKVARVPPQSAAEASGWSVDAVLVDTYSPASPGGTGQTGDWAAAADFVARCSKRVLLAGGLTPDNVAEAARRVKPWGLDVSSGVEREPGRKDLKKVREFIERCRSW